MHIMVYAPYGRAGITMMQDYCRLLRIGVRDEDLRGLGRTGQDAANRPSDCWRREAGEGLCTTQRARRRVAEPTGSRLFRAAALRLARAVRPQFRALVLASGLPTRRCGGIDGAPHGARLVALSSPAQHAAVELLRGTMDRHSFVAYRDDREREAQPILFEGDAWRSFVRVRLPWRLAVKDRAPRGVAAVLINPTHTYPDACTLHRRCSGTVAYGNRRRALHRRDLARRVRSKRG